MENLPFNEEMEEFIGKSILLRGGRVSDSLSVYLPLLVGTNTCSEIFKTIHRILEYFTSFVCNYIKIVSRKEGAYTTVNELLKLLQHPHA